MKLKEILKERLEEKELQFVPRSFDIVGSGEKSVAIVEIPKEIENKENLIAKTIIQLNKNVKSVLRKISERKGEFRIRRYKLIVGDSNTEVVHKEYGYLLKLDPQKVYFSPRESTERQRIATQVKPNETVMLMFSGIGCMAVAIAKKQPKVGKIIAVEINPSAVDYMKENLRMNKISHLVSPVLGDVKKVCKNFYGKCDRVIMPLPIGAEKFLDVAVNCLKEKGIIHFYNIGSKDGLFSNAEKLIEEKLKSLKKRYKIISKRKILQYAPRKWKICIDLMVK